jgi:hypothetical protein
LPSRACDACTIFYPDGVLDCPVCGNTLRYSPAAPMADWETRAHDAIELQPQGEPVGGPAIDVRVVTDEHGRRWLYSAQVRGAGYHAALVTFDRFVTPDGLVELQGLDAPRARWWIEVL